jgi:hypothetical protein
MQVFRYQVHLCRVNKLTPKATGRELKLLRVAPEEKAEYTLRCELGGFFARDNQDDDSGA